MNKQQILKTTTCAFNSFNSFSQPWQSSVEIKVLKQSVVLHFQKVTLTSNVSLTWHLILFAWPVLLSMCLSSCWKRSCSHVSTSSLQKPCSTHLLSAIHTFLIFPELKSRQPSGPRSSLSKAAHTRSMDKPRQLPEVPYHALLALSLRVMNTVGLLF